MKRPMVFVLLSATCLAACSSFEGTYSPNCIAYEGDNITLTDGGFIWDRFTDAIPVDRAGNPIDPTPGYPLQGRYSEQDGVLSLQTDSGESRDPLFVRRQNGNQYLLTSEQVEHLEDTGEIPDCSLVLGGFEGRD